MKDVPLLKPHWQQLMLLLLCLVTLCKVRAQTYDFKVGNEDGVIIYYYVNGENAIVTFGDEKYTGKVKIPSSVQFNSNTLNVIAIGEKAFYFCQSLESIDIPSSVTAIADYAFYECSSLEAITFPSKLLSIGDNAFGGCSKLKSIEFPEGLTSLGRSVFNGCDNLSTVKLSSTISKIGVSAFGHTPALSTITVDANNATYDSRNNCNAIIETSTNTLVTGCKTTKIPDNVAVIGDNAFYFCQSLESIDIPSSVTAIADYTFYECSSLETVVLPTNVKSIGNSAFYGCTSLVTIGSHIKNPFDISNNVFNQSTKETAKLKVPTGTKNTYQSTAGWEFANIVEDTNEDDNNGDNNENGNSEISLVVWAKDGSKVAFALSKRPKVTFTETDLQITGKGIDANYPLEKMARFTYEMVDITAIKDIKTEKVAFRFAGESLLFPALKANSTVSIYSLNGTLVFKKKVQADGEYSFPISNLNTGVYLISVNGLTYKIVKR